MKKPWLPVSIRLEPEGPDPRTFAACLAALAARLDETPVPMRVEIRGAARGGLPVVLDFLPDGSALHLSCGTRRARNVDLRRRWIAEHPVPLAIRPGRKTVLYVTPADANRFRVSDRPTLAWLTSFWRKRP